MPQNYDPAKYDPVARRERYLRNRELKGRQKGTQKPTTGRSGASERSSGSGSKSRNPTRPSSSQNRDSPQQAKARVGRLKAKISTLQGALTKALAELAEKRRSAAETERKNSDGKTTAKERQDSKEYRDKHKEEIASKRQKESSSSKGGSSASAAASRDAAVTSVAELEARISKIRTALASAKKQLSDAMTASGQLSHSDDTALEFRLDAPTSRKESVHMEADFGGYATRHGVPCADGRTILPGAFKENDGQIVPLVYQHGHNSIDNVLGHCKLEYRDDGVYAHAYFNETASGQNAKIQVQHGDLKFLSIFANQLQEKVKPGLEHAAQKLKDVIKGNIREVSLVLAGANPGAYIDNITLAHGFPGDYDETEAIITTGMEIELSHDDLSHSEEDETLQDVLDTLDEKQAEAVTFLLSHALAEGGSINHSDIEELASSATSDDGETLQHILDTLNEKQTTAVNFLLTEAILREGESVKHSDTDEDVDAEEDDAEGAAEISESEDNSDADSAGDDDTTNADGDTESGNNEAGDDVQHNDSQEDNSMTHNLFDQAKHAGAGRPTVSLAHGSMTQEDALKAIVKDAKKNGSLKEALENYLEHTGIEVNGTLQHGIENIEYLFPDAQTLENSPAFISRRMEWVDTVLSGVRKSPFSRIKTITADITPDEARARGYIKGNMKNEEFFALSKRETTPQTIYKKQKLDRDDVIDITTLDVVAWLKAEMKVMLDEELAGAILVGDGRSVGDDDKIKETNIRPIASDAELYVTTVNVNLDDADSSVEELVDAVINNRRYYKGSGQPTFFTTESTISAFLTVKDNFGRRIYANLQEVAAVLRVAAIVPVEVMERVPDLVGIMVNLADYTLGADRGGQATMFDDFDIDYNKLRYLIETRCSGALTLPKAALVFRKVAGTDVLRTPTEPAFDGTTVTVPTVTGVTYKNADTNATLTTAAPVTLADGDSIRVVAVPNAGSYFANNAEDEWTFTNPA